MKGSTKLLLGLILTGLLITSALSINFILAQNPSNPGNENYRTVLIDGKPYRTISIQGKEYALIPRADAEGKSYKIKGAALAIVAVGLLAKLPRALKRKRVSNPKAVKLALAELKKHGKLNVYLDSNILWGYFNDVVQKEKGKPTRGYGRRIEFLRGRGDILNLFVSNWVKAEIGRQLRTDWHVTKPTAMKIWKKFKQTFSIKFIPKVTFENEIDEITFEQPFKKRVNNILHLHIARTNNLFFVTDDKEVVEKCPQFYAKVLRYRDLREAVENYLSTGNKPEIDNYERTRKRENDATQWQKSESNSSNSENNTRRVRSLSQTNSQTSGSQADEGGSPQAKSSLTSKGQSRLIPDFSFATNYLRNVSFEIRSGQLKGSTKLFLGVVLFSLILASTLAVNFILAQKSPDLGNENYRTVLIDGKNYRTISIDGKEYALIPKADAEGKSYKIKGVYYPDYSCQAPSEFKSLVNTTGEHTLAFTFGDASAEAYNLAFESSEFLATQDDRKFVRTQNNTGFVELNWTTRSEPYECDANTVGLWHFDGSAGDACSSNDGVIQGGAGFGQGRFGQGIDLDGSNDYVSCGTTDLPTGAEERTVEAWFKANSFPTGRPTIAGYGNDTNNKFGDFKIAVRNNGGVEVRYNGADLDSAAALVSTGEWHHLAATYNGTFIRLYLDGSQVASESRSLNTGVGTVYCTIGRLDATNGDYFNGTIDEVRISNKARSPEEIRENYRQGYYRHLAQDANKTVNWLNISWNQTGVELNPDENTTLLWHFAEGVGTVAKDASSNNNVGTVVNATWVTGCKFDGCLEFNGDGYVIVEGG